MANPNSDSYSTTSRNAYVGRPDDGTPSAIGLTLTGPSSGSLNTASSNFTVTFNPSNGIMNGTVQVYPNDNNGSGSFTPSSVTLTNKIRSATFTYTGTTGGSKSISITNNKGLSNPAALTYTIASAVTGLTITGPTSGVNNVASTNFTVGLLPTDGTVTGTITITPSSGAGGGSFSPTTVSLTNTTRTATFTYTPTTAGSKTISISNNQALTNPSSITYSVSAGTASAITLSGPTTGLVGSPSSSFSVGVSPVGGTITGTVVVTPNDSSGGGTFTPTTVSLTNASPTASFTYTPGSAGTKTIGVTNNGSLTNPTAISYSAVVSGGGSTGSAVTTIVITETSGAAGTYPFSATVLPLKGKVPSGNTIISPDDSTLRTSILSTYDDGSAALAVVSGTIQLNANQVKVVGLEAASSATGSNLTTSAISSRVTSVVVNFGGTYGTATLSSFSAPEKTWWANPSTICARYRLAAPTPGSTSLEAVIDITAYSDRALVEVVVENSKMTSSSPVKPAAATYTDASISVNGTTIATVSAAGAPEGNHAAFRAWYARGWAGVSASNVRAVQDHFSLQDHPLFFRLDQLNTASLTAYASDAYTPWSTGRQRATNMGGTGDHASIGPLPLWETQALQTGDIRCWNATEVSALACLGYGINYRENSTGAVPTFSAVGTKAMASGSWPSTAYNGAMGWEVAHAPALGLMAFVGRPSPVFIELAQKAAITAGSWSADNDEALPDGAWTAGVCGTYYQVRGKAWTLRQIAHATFLSISDSGTQAAWRTSAQSALSRNATLLNAYRTNVRNVFKFIWGGTQSNPEDQQAGVAGIQFALWENWFLTAELHKIDKAEILASGTPRTTMKSVTDWLCEGVAFWVTSQPSGGWRYIPYKPTVCDSTATADAFSTWEAQRNRAGNHTDVPSSVSGTWMTNGGSPTTYAAYTADAVGGFFYVEPFWMALVASRERDVTGAATAWTTVQNNITNLNTWRAGFSSEPRWGAWPRYGDTSVWDGGTGASYKGSGTFNTLTSIYNSISSTGGWAQVPNTTLSTATPSNAAIDAIAPNAVLRQGEQDNFHMIWSSAAWNGYGWFYVVAGGHFAGYRNDTYIIRLSDPVGVVRMHMPSPIEAVWGRPGHPTHDGLIIPPSDWGSPVQNDSNTSSATVWGPRGCHQYSGMIWVPELKKMVVGLDSNVYVTNPTAYNSAVQIQSAVYVFDPYAPTPARAWRRFKDLDTNSAMGALGMVDNGNGTVSFRGYGGAVPTRTVDVLRGNVVSGTVYGSPRPETYSPWRHVVRDKVTGKSYETHEQTIGSGGSQDALYETTSGSYVKITNLPTSYWVNPGEPYRDNQSSILLNDNKAYVINQSGPGPTSSTVTLAIQQVDLSTNAVTTSGLSPTITIPEGLYQNTSLNGIHGRFGFVPEVGCFVVQPTARGNIWMYRPPASWGISGPAGVSGQFSLSFPSNVSATDKLAPYAALEFTNPHLNGLGMWGNNNTSGVTIVRKLRTRQQNGYYAQLWYTRADGTFDGVCWGAHPYPVRGYDVTNTGAHVHEVAVNGLDVIDSAGTNWSSGMNSGYPPTLTNGTLVTHGQTYVQGMRITRNSASSKTLRYYFNLPNVNSANYAETTVTTSNFGESALPSAKLVIGDSPWYAAYQHERFSGELDAIKIFNSVLSEADMLAESQDFSRIVTPAGQASIWYGKNGFDSVNDLTCHFGTGRALVRNDSANLITTAARL